MEQNQAGGNKQGQKINTMLRLCAGHSPMNSQDGKMGA